VVGRGHDSQAPAPRAAPPRRDDAAIVHEYGELDTSFGGLYVEGDSLVALFTADIDMHSEHLYPLVAASDQLVVRLAARTWKEVIDANDRVASILFRSQIAAGVTGAGIGLRDGQFVVCVSIDPYTEVLAQRVRDMVFPDLVDVEQRKHATQR
jgi:hypothetical protein